jgi:hypothetical protein
MDDMVIFEIMTEELDKPWWKQYKKELETTFAQDEIIIRVQKVRAYEVVRYASSRLCSRTQFLRDFNEHNYRY